MADRGGLKVKGCPSYPLPPTLCQVPPNPCVP
jgi:hypothetical protein